MRWHSGILDREPRWDRHELLVLAATPGIPLEWIYAGAGLGWRRRASLRAMIDGAKSDQLEELGRENAASVAQGDGWRMLHAVAPGYSGPVPMWSRLELQNDARSNAAIGALLGVHREVVRRWRRNTVFCPLTGRRLRNGRGGFHQ